MPIDDKRPGSAELAASLQTQIQEGAYAPGQQLPSYRQLATEHAVAIGTAQAAVRLLQKAGLIEIRQGSGAYVRSPSESVPVHVELERLRDRLQRSRQELTEAEAHVADLLARIPAETPRDNGEKPT